MVFILSHATKRLLVSLQSLRNVLKVAMFLVLLKGLSNRKMKQELLLQPGFFQRFAFFVKIGGTSAEKGIKDAAKLRMDHDVLGQVCETDLIAKELMMHRQCYIDYTLCLEEQSQDVDKDDNNDGQRKMKDDFDQVKDFIQDTIIESEKAVSITAVHKIYGTGYGHEHEKVYRNRLK